MDPVLTISDAVKDIRAFDRDDDLPPALGVAIDVISSGNVLNEDQWDALLDEAKRNPGVDAYWGASIIHHLLDEMKGVVPEEVKEILKGLVDHKPENPNASAHRIPGKPEFEP